MSTGAFCFLRFSLTTTRPAVPMWILRRDGLTVLTAAERYAQGIACMLKLTTRKPYSRGCSHKSASVRSCSLQLSGRSMMQRFKRGRPELSFHVLARRRCCERESTFLQPFIIISQLDSIVARTHLGKAPDLCASAFARFLTPGRLHPSSSGLILSAQIPEAARAPLHDLDDSTTIYYTLLRPNERP